MPLVLNYLNRPPPNAITATLNSIIIPHTNCLTALLVEEKSIYGDQMKTTAKRSYDVNPDKIFQILSNILSKSHDVKRIDSEIRIMEISSGVSLFSFGETFEIIVASQDAGSVVSVKTKSKVKWNVTSNVKDKAEQIFELLDKNLN